MDVKGIALLQLYNKRKLKNGTKTYLQQNFSLFIVKFKKLWFSASLRVVVKTTWQVISNLMHPKFMDHCL